jgi:cephalosporin-C deacetylase-like acetyl esterase
MHKRPKALTLTFVCAAFLGPLSLPAQGPAEDPVLQWMDGIAQRDLDQRDVAIGQIHTKADAERRQKWVREKLIELMGGLPDYKGPLNARITGHIQAEGYVIEKVIFDSLPGIYVTGNVYRPNQPGHYPAVLFQSGHTQEGKAEPQLAAANLALKGFVVLCFDPIGQGERLQSFDRQLGRSASNSGGSGNDHVQMSAQSVLIGQGGARYFIWDSIRALDYLVSRPDVDAKRVGALGCSGGGSSTTFIAALDSRIKAAAPACFTNSYRLLFSGPDPDPEMEFPGFLASGLDHADFAESAAPMPWLIMATEHDYYSPEGAKLVYDEARRWYRLFGAEDRVRFFVGSGQHGTPPESREAMYEWMIRWLKDGHGDFLEHHVKLYNNHELQVTRTGQVEDEPNSRKVYQVILDEYRARKRPGTLDELQAELRRLEIPSDGSAPSTKVLDEKTSFADKVQSIRYESEPGVEIKGKLYIPNFPAGRKPAVLLVADRASNRWIMSTTEFAEMLAKSGHVVLEMDPRDSPFPVSPYSTMSPEAAAARAQQSFVGNWLADTRADLIGRNLPAMRAHDMVRGVDLLAARSDVDPASIRAAARGVPGIWLLLAAAADRRIVKLWLDHTPYNLRSALENSIDIHLYDAAISGLVLHWDVEDLIKAMGGSHAVVWSDPIDWRGQLAYVGDPSQYRFVLGDDNDIRDEMDQPFIDEFVK